MNAEDYLYRLIDAIENSLPIESSRDNKLKKALSEAKNFLDFGDDDGDDELDDDFEDGLNEPDWGH